MSDIEWTNETWNPLRGCRRISPGCEHCYAERQAARPILSGPDLPYEGLVQIGKQGPRWTGTTSGRPDKLDVPLRWKKGRRIFVCSMSDLFYEGHSDDDIARVFAIMAACQQHTFQVLTKRAERMAQWFAGRPGYSAYERTSFFSDFDLFPPTDDPANVSRFAAAGIPWPLPNVWIGISVEDQKRAEERLPHLLRVPAAVRFVSYEPALGPVNFRRWLSGRRAIPGVISGVGFDVVDRIDWLIVGGESGRGARPFDLAWARSAIAQCGSAGVPCFVKQLGSRPIVAEERWRLALRDRKGGDPSEWPADLQVREWPEVRR